jgi:hypothetical protein
MEAVKAFLERRLKLKVNASKSAVARPWQRKYLGYSMTWHKKPKLKIAEASRERLAEKLRKTMREARGKSLKQTIERLNPVLRGWIAYFRLTEVKGMLEELDGWIRRKLRTVLWCGRTAGAIPPPTRSMGGKPRNQPYRNCENALPLRGIFRQC